MKKLTILFLFYIKASLGVSNAVNLNSSGQTSKDSTRNSSESAPTNPQIEEYKRLAQQYQAVANHYKALASVAESTPVTPTKMADVVYNPWEGTQISLGGGNTTGNVTSTNLQNNVNINFKPNPSDNGWNFAFLSQYNYLSSSTHCNEVNRFYAQDNTYYMFDKYNGMFGQASYLNDLSSGYYYVWNENIGYQLQLFRTPRSNLLFSLGPGLQQRQVTGASTATNTPTWLSQAIYNFQINDLLDFQERLLNIATAINTTTTSNTTLSIKVYKKIAISLTYQIIYNSVPEPNKAALDSLSSVNFVYAL
jgi:putative salt-induced outer membrane protein YdiY